MSINDGVNVLKKPDDPLGVGPNAPVATNSKGGKQSTVQFRCDLLPPLAVLEVAKVLKQGAEKYAINNWKLIDVNDHINHAMIHAFAFLNGDTSDDHLSHAACRMLMALQMKLEEQK